MSRTRRSGGDAARRAGPPQDARARSVLPRVDRLDAQRALDAREALDHDAAQRRRSPGSRRATRCVASTSCRSASGRRVEARDERVGDVVAARLPDAGERARSSARRPAAARRGRSRAGSPGPWRARWRSAARTLSTSDANAASLPSAVGIVARARAAAWAPLAVLSASSAASISASPGGAHEHEALEQLPAQVGVDLEAVERDRAVAQAPERRGVRSGSRRSAAKNFTNWNCASEPASRLLARASRAPSPTSARTAARRAAPRSCGRSAAAA